MKDLDRRLSAIISEIDCDVLADIGCDHGYIGGRIRRVGRL